MNFLFLQLNYNGLEELCRDRMILETILASPNSIQAFIPSLVKSMMRRSKYWASEIPPMLFPPPRLNEAVEKVRDLCLTFPYSPSFYLLLFIFQIIKFTSTLPSLTKNEIQGHHSIILNRIATFKKRGAELKSGKLKNEMCQWWLDHIQKRVDGSVFFFFLCFLLNYIPFSFPFSKQKPNQIKTK